MVINCYRKFAQLLEMYPSFSNINKSLFVIRFEIQCKYPKLYSIAKNEHYKSMILDSLDDTTDDKIKEFIDELQCGGQNLIPVDMLLSDAVSADIIKNISVSSFVKAIITP